MQQDMLKYKNEFAIRFATIMQKKVQSWKKIQRQKRLSLLNFQSIIVYLVGLGVGFIPFRNEHSYDIKLHCIWAFFTFIVSVLYNIHIVNKDYQKIIKGTLFSSLLKVFFDGIKYANGGGSSAIMHIDENIIENSGLFKKEITERTDDDVFYGDYKGVNFIMNETDFGYISRDIDGHGHYRKRYNRMFKGLVMQFKLNKLIKSKILITQKGHFFRTPAGYEPVHLEDTVFSKKYNVYAQDFARGVSGQIEARYLLNALFINRFLQLKTSFKVSKIFCYVYGETMLVFLDTNKDLFEMNHLFKRIDDKSQYQHLFDEFASVFSFMDVLNITSKTKL